MNCIELMIEEHENIKRMLSIIRKYCYKVLKNEPVQYEDFLSIIDFVRNYADKHHHGKEETMLFNRMSLELGEDIEKLVNYGMLAEHDLGRLYMRELEEAVKKVIDGDDEARLDVIANAISYTHLLNRHIIKENNAVYKYAVNNLDQKTLDEINRECEEFEQDPKNREVKQRYLKLMDELEAKLQ